MILVFRWLRKWELAIAYNCKCLVFAVYFLLSLRVYVRTTRINTQLMEKWDRAAWPVAPYTLAVRHTVKRYFNWSCRHPIAWQRDKEYIVHITIALVQVADAGMRLYSRRKAIHLFSPSHCRPRCRVWARKPAGSWSYAINTVQDVWQRKDKREIACLPFRFLVIILNI